MKSIKTNTIIFLTITFLLCSCTEKKDKLIQNNQATNDQIIKEEIKEEINESINNIDTNIKQDYELVPPSEKNQLGVIDATTVISKISADLKETYQTLPKYELISQPIIDKKNGLIYDYNPEDPVYPEGPLYDENGRLYFKMGEKAFVYSNKAFTLLENTDNYPKEFDCSKYLPEHFANDAYTYYKIDKGIIIEDYRHQMFIGVDLSDPKKPKSIHAEDFNNWNSFTKSGFTYNSTIDDGNPGLLKNDVLWSISKAYYAAITLDSNFEFVGKMFTGHNIFYNTKSFLIVDNSGKILCEILIPWRQKNNKKTYLCKMSWCLGKYGEIYALIGPEKDNLDKAKNAELVVINNFFEHFGVIDVDELVLFSEPMDDSKVINFYQENTGFFFEETTINDENPINDETWYKVRLLDGTIGYFKGVNIKSLKNVPKSPYPWS